MIRSLWDTPFGVIAVELRASPAWCGERIRAYGREGWKVSDFGAFLVAVRVVNPRVDSVVGSGQDLGLQSQGQGGGDTSEHA